MGKLLLVVEDSFQFSTRGTTVAPFVSPEAVGTSRSGHKQQVRLVRPDGAEEIVEATFYWEHLNPIGFRFRLLLEQGSKEQVPLGTEIWLLDN
ncbi:MAG TPA: hypothetical protein V6C84_29015 [Coleofasciculaceae cyanobacterium]